MTTVHVVWRPGYDDEVGEAVAVCATAEIAAQVEAMVFDSQIEELPLVENLEDAVRVRIFVAQGYRASSGLWSFSHDHHDVWKWAVRVSEAEITERPVVKRFDSVLVQGTDEAEVGRVFDIECSRVEASYRGEGARIRTKVEELDPHERF